MGQVGKTACRRGVGAGVRRWAVLWGCGLIAGAASVTQGVPVGYEGEYQLVVQAHGPRRYDVTNGCLLLMDEPSGAAQATDIMRTPEMAIEGWGSNPTGHHGAASGVQFGVTGKQLLAGELDRCAYFDGAGRLTITDVLGDFDFATSARFSFGVRVMSELRAGPGKWSIVSRVHDGTNVSSEDDDRGWRLVLVQRADGTQRLRFEMFDNRNGPNAMISSEAGVNIQPGVAYTVVCTFGGWEGASALGVYVRGNGVTSHTQQQIDTDEWYESVQDIRGGTLRVGGDHPSMGGFRGHLAGLYVEPRRLAVEDIDHLHTAATVPLATPVREANLGVIRDAVRGRSFARVIGDSTSAPTGVSVGNSIPRRLELDGLIPRRNAHPKEFNGASLPPPQYVEYPIMTTLDLAPGGVWSSVPARRGYSFYQVVHKALDTPENAVALQLTDGTADVMTSETFPRLHVRAVYPRAEAASVSQAARLTANNGIESRSVTIHPRGPSTLFSATDLVFDAPGNGNVVISMRGTESNEASTEYGMYAVWLMNADSYVNGQPGLWWAGAVAKDGATTIPHVDDNGFYTMANIDEYDAALTQGVYPFDHKVVFVLLTINDSNGNLPVSVLRNNFQTIADRWIARGYKVCFIQPWVPFFISSSNPQRIPVNTYDQYWRDAFLPLAGGDIGVVSLHQWFRGVPYQFLEGTTSPSWAVHALDSPSALRLLIPFSRSMKATPHCFADFNGVDGVDVADLFAYINAWLAKAAAADVNGDNRVDVADLFVYINGWLAKC